VVHTQEAYVLYVCTKFEADSLIHPKVISGSQHFEIGSRDPGHLHLGVVSWSIRWKSSSYVFTKLEANSYSFKKL